MQKPQDKQEQVRVQIRKAIDDLHQRNSGDWQTLMRQVNKATKLHVVKPNYPQFVADAASDRMYMNAKHQLQGISLFCEWGRGTGKTTMRGWRRKKMLKQLPRSTGLLIGPSYQFLLTRIIPSLVQGLEMFGLYEGLHYFIAQKPPPKWRNYWGKAYQRPDKYDRYITYFNGMGEHLISHDVKGDGRGLNTDWLDGDEAALLKPNELQESSGPTKRGTNTKEFYGKPLFGSEFYTSSTPLTEDGQWFIGMEEQALLHPKRMTFIKATCEHNLHNLRPGYLEDAKLSAYSEWKFLAEYYNVRPNFTSNGFYGSLNPDIHYYSNGHDNYDFYQPTREKLLSAKTSCKDDIDLTRGLPLIAGADWGAAINCLVVCQHLRDRNELRALKDFYVLSEDQKMQDDLADDFAEYYSDLQTKELYLWYDNTGNNKTGNTRKTRAEQFAARLRPKGWKVYPMSIGGSNPLHDRKHLVWENILREDRDHLPRFKINKHNCSDTATSMRFAKATADRHGNIKKDKRSERRKSVARQHATDLSDAIDSVVYGMFKDSLKHRAGGLPGLRITTH